VLLKEAAEYDKAMPLFERALAVRPGDPGVRYQIVTIYVSRGESEKALPLLEGIVKESPDFLEAHVTLATVYYRLKRREDGDRHRAVVDRLNKEIQAKQPSAVAPNQPPDVAPVP
jgi:tetratricopeptide (TPR) repeat protein